MTTLKDYQLRGLLSRKVVEGLKPFPGLGNSRADSVQHRFDDETEMDGREYISRKYGLYREAGETNQDNIVRRIHDGLDPTLAAAIPLRGANNIMNDF